MAARRAVPDEVEPDGSSRFASRGCRQVSFSAGDHGRPLPLGAHVSPRSRPRRWVRAQHCSIGDVLAARRTPAAGEGRDRRCRLGTRPPSWRIAELKNSIGLPLTGSNCSTTSEPPCPVLVPHSPVCRSPACSSDPRVATGHDRAQAPGQGVEHPATGLAQPEPIGQSAGCVAVAVPVERRAVSLPDPGLGDRVAT
jgi:hypothetical protein